MGITSKQKQIYDYLKEYTEKNGYSPTQREIKEHFNLKSFGSVQRYIKYLEDAGLLIRSKHRNCGLQINSLNKENFEIPLLGDIAAGDPLLAIEDPQETISVPSNFISSNNKYFALRVKGESMIEEGILEGDILICKQQNQANKGQIIIAMIDEEATVKYYYPHRKEAQRHLCQLCPANSSMSPINVNMKTQNFRILGIPSGLIRSYN